MDFNKYVVEDLDNDLEAVFADMMDEGFEVKKRAKELELFDVIMTKRTGTGWSFNIKQARFHRFKTEMKGILSSVNEASKN